MGYGRRYKKYAQELRERLHAIREEKRLKKKYRYANIHVQNMDALTRMLADKKKEERKAEKEAKRRNRKTGGVEENLEKKPEDDLYGAHVFLLNADESIDDLEVAFQSKV